MHSSKDDFLTQYEITEDVFESQMLDLGKLNTYVYIADRFRELFRDYADSYALDNCKFRIKSDVYCNADALKIADHNFIAITIGYLSLMERTFDEKYFSTILLVAIINEKTVSEAFYDLHEDPDFHFHEFMLDCSIYFTFCHEFQHILQWNSSKIARDCRHSENLDTTNFDLTSHALEFNADRIASFRVLVYVFSVYGKFVDRNTDKLKCLIYLGLASICITKSLFYFRVMNQSSPTYTIDKQDFYTKKFSHPHPLVRIYNILEYFYTNVENDFPELKIDSQQILNNVLGIMKIYFDSLIPDQNVMEGFFDDSKNFLDEINKYNQELYDASIEDKSIRTLLKARGIKF